VSTLKKRPRPPDAFAGVIGGPRARTSAKLLRRGTGQAAKGAIVEGARGSAVLVDASIVGSVVARAPTTAARPPPSAHPAASAAPGGPAAAVVAAASSSAAMVGSVRSYPGGWGRGADGVSVCLI
jgi:hypothetical protein